ncbi:hypothetical protein MtrunA17_Chr7g0249471 [Medicago truncatula]|uniref:Transmembrane protein n=1 Tax=Medicago truncatula TaxID=3880 RepID=A0A396H1K4_MEDTR|nr:hypothetical protein MtrunA17_Chr7g0249471 [Medicago truncatula]
MAEIQIEIHPNPSRFIIWIRLLVICGRHNRVCLYRFRFLISFSHQAIVVLSCACVVHVSLIFCYSIVFVHCGGGYGGRGGGGYGSGCKPVQGGGVVMAMVCSLSNFIFN